MHVAASYHCGCTHVTDRLGLLILLMRVKLAVDSGKRRVAPHFDSSEVCARPRHFCDIRTQTVPVHNGCICGHVIA